MLVTQKVCMLSIKAKKQWALRPECITYHVWSNSPTPTAKQQKFEVVDAQLNTVDITAKRDRTEQAQVHRVQVVWLPDVASKDCE